MEIQSVSSASEAAREAAQYVSAVLARLVGTPVLFLVSGGSAMPILTYISGDVLGQHLTLGVLDERFTSDPETNNFLTLARTTFYQYAVNRNAQIISSVPAAGERLEDAAARLDRQYRSWIAANPQGRIVITQGIGPDGHTAGIMPFPDDQDRFKEMFVDTERFVVGYDAGSRTSFPFRITVTMPFLERVDESVLYVCGDTKRPALRRIVSREGTLAETPGLVVSLMKHVVLFTDILL